MEDKEAMVITDRKENSQSHVAGSDRRGKDANSISNEGTSFAENIQSYTVNSRPGEDVSREKEPQHDDQLIDINMEAEAAISPDDVVRAGGFGARDDISSFLPVAIDSTDFEASLRDARGYEEPQGEQRRPGLGWREQGESE